jgi:hypothetical protein
MNKVLGQGQEQLEEQGYNDEEEEDQDQDQDHDPKKHVFIAPKKFQRKFYFKFFFITA